MLKTKHLYFLYLVIFLLSSCSSENPVNQEEEQTYSISGRITDNDGNPLSGIQVFYTETLFVSTNLSGNWTINNLSDSYTVRPSNENYTFLPESVLASEESNSINFEGTRILNTIENAIYNWFSAQQLSNGLLESSENGNVVSLYDNALAALVFIMQEDYAKAERIFDFFNGRVQSELNNGVGGFSQFRDRNGVPSGNRWMGDNAWLLIAINNYKEKTSNSTYDNLASEITQWLKNLQDSDGGLYAGYDSNNQLLNYKVTEGNIDAFNAIDGYDVFHSRLLNFLESDRWDSQDKNLVAWPGNPAYLYALDCHSWSYCIFPQYPISSLTTADRFLNTQTATNGQQVTGYCFDEDKDTVWPEGTAQMALAFDLAGMNTEKEYYLRELEKVLTISTTYNFAAGFPYATNPGTYYGTDVLWNGADTEIAISGGAWYLFATFGFNPFEVGRNKNIPIEDKFWTQ